MGRRARSSGYQTDVPRAERIELVRRLIVAGVPDWRIRRDLVAGIELGDGRKFTVNRNTAAKYLAEIGLEYQRLHDDPLVIERVVGACAERLARIADKAEGAGHWQAAIRANLALVDVVGRASLKWSRRATDTSIREDDAPQTYDDLTDDELVAELERKRERARALGLEVLAGGS